MPSCLFTVIRIDTQNYRDLTPLYFEPRRALSIVRVTGATLWRKKRRRLIDVSNWRPLPFILYSLEIVLYKRVSSLLGVLAGGTFWQSVTTLELKGGDPINSPSIKGASSYTH